MRFLPAFVATGILLAGGATLWAIEAQAGILKISDGVLLEYKTATWTGKRGPAGPIFGSDDPIPHTDLKELTLIRRVARIRLDVSCMYDPWFERVHSSRFKFTVLNSRAATLIGSLDWKSVGEGKKG